MRGYFGIGVEGISKAHNLGNLMRSAHAFGAEFFFAIAPDVRMQDVHRSDTAHSDMHVPFYTYDSVSDLVLPKGCVLTGVEFIEDAVELPSFRHPVRAAYILGPEMGSLSDAALSRCGHIIKIPLKFCINVGVAGALVMYDRMVSAGRFPPRPVKSGGPDGAPGKHRPGPRRLKRKNH
mgnify:CR=1 FL=1